VVQHDKMIDYKHSETDTAS